MRVADVAEEYDGGPPLDGGAGADAAYAINKQCEGVEPSVWILRKKKSID